MRARAGSRGVSDVSDAARTLSARTSRREPVLQRDTLRRFWASGGGADRPSGDACHEPIGGRESIKNFGSRDEHATRARRSTRRAKRRSANGGTNVAASRARAASRRADALGSFVALWNGHRPRQAAGGEEVLAQGMQQPGPPASDRTIELPPCCVPCVSQDHPHGFVAKPQSLPDGRPPGQSARLPMPQGRRLCLTVRMAARAGSAHQR